MHGGRGTSVSCRKKIDSSILEASKQFDVQTFVEIIKGEFSDFPDHRYNQKRTVYPIWYIGKIFLG
jgi:hypothetical protein